MENLLIYIKHPKYILMDIKDWYNKRYIAKLNKYREEIYNYELEVFSNKITEPTYGTYVSDLHIGIFSPIMVVTKTLEKHFGFEGLMRLQIHGIDVDTQKQVVDITFRLHRPGLLIGRGGQTLEDIRNMLEIAFNTPIMIHIVEVKTDINAPINFSF